MGTGCSCHIGLVRALVLLLLPVFSTVKPATMCCCIWTAVDLQVRWDGEDQHVFMTGPAEEVFRGQIELEAGRK